MIRESIAKYIGYPLQDSIRGTNILKTLELLRESQYWEEAKLEEYRLNKLKRLIEFSSRNVPYYQNLFRDIKLKASDIIHLEDISKIPILTKEIVRKEFNNLIAGNLNMKYVKRGKTGGTTGAPVIVLKDVSNRSFTWASYYRWYEWMGINYFDGSATLWGAPTVLKSSPKKKCINNFRDFVQNDLSINSFNMQDDELHVIYDKIKNFNPVIIKGYLSALVRLGSYIEENSKGNLNAKVIASTSETLLPHYRKYLEKIFCAPVFDQYGCGEISAISYECSKHNGLHINQEHVICEFIDIDDNILKSSTKRILATDLDNYVMPFIRFENGDLGSLSGKRCTCGVNQPLMDSIEGRSIDTITLKNGSKVHGVFFTDIFFELGVLADRVPRFQVFQSRPGEIEFRYELEGQLDSNLKERLVIALMKFFNNVEIKEVKQLETEKNGKFKYIINEPGIVNNNLT